MFEYDASLAFRVELIETAMTAIFETLPKGHEARSRLVEILEYKIKHVGFAHERRHQLERTLEHIRKNMNEQDVVGTEGQ